MHDSDTARRITACYSALSQLRRRARPPAEVVIRLHGARRTMPVKAQPIGAPRPDATTGGTAALDDIFAALSDPIRRAIIARLTGGPCSVTQLGAPFAVSAPAIS